MPRHRVLIIASLLFLPSLMAWGRLLYLQGWAAEDYRDQILRKRTGVAVLPVPRGSILSRNGEVLAADERGFEARVRLGDFQKDPKTFDLLCRLLDARPEDIAARLQRIQHAIEARLAARPEPEQKRLRLREHRAPFPLLDDISFGAAIEIDVHPDLFAGLDVEEKLRRRYPLRAVGAHAVGYIGNIHEQEYQALLANGFFREELGEAVGDAEFESLLRRGVFQQEVLGRSGVEARFQKELRGKRGAVLRERDTNTGEIRVVAAASARPGRDIRLALDGNAQREAERALASSSTRCGAIVAMDVETGEVLVMASSPGYDPNDLAPPPNNEAYRRLLADPGRPFVNRATSAALPLGSVFKIVVATAALQERKIDPGTTFTCTGSLTVAGHTYHCWIHSHGGGHGEMNVVSALQHSCNVFFYNCGQRLGVDAMARWAGAFGLGKKSGVDLYGERAGAVPGPVPGARGNPGDPLNLAIGQGALLVTPLQAARATAAIANGGRLLRPRLVIEDGMKPEAVDLGVRPEVLDVVRRGMWAVVNEEGGTGYRSGMSSVNAAGKTGTAQAGGNRPDHAWFVACFPHEKPRYAICVLVEHGGKGSEAAAPLATPVAEALMRLEANKKVPASGESTGTAPERSAAETETPEPSPHESAPEER